MLLTPLLLSAHAKGQVPTITTRRIGPTLIYERLWLQACCRHVIDQLLGLAPTGTLCLITAH